MAHEKFEVILVGAGLANVLTALALLERRPDIKLLLIDRAPTVGGNHTWSFHELDVPASAKSWVERLIARRWPGYDVAFPGYERHVASGYATLTTASLVESLQAALSRAPQSRLLLRATATSVRKHSVELADGTRLLAGAVIDARGPERIVMSRAPGYQKFVGLELELASDAPRELPLLMDARVQQLDGYRFVYVLPFSPRRVLIEDTYYSRSAGLDRSQLRERILSYALAHGYAVARILREETGVLPLPIRAPGKLEEAGSTAAEPAFQAGYQGGWFHPTTGYSFPIALRLAEWIAEQGVAAFDSSAFATLCAEHLKQQRFCTLLNRLLFSAFEPDQRLHVLERFYTLPDASIARFYAMQTTALDRAKILCGRPPKGFSLRRMLTRGATQ